MGRKLTVSKIYLNCSSNNRPAAVVAAKECQVLMVGLLCLKNFCLAICLQIHKKFPHVRLKNQEEKEKEKIVSLSLKTQKSL